MARAAQVQSYFNFVKGLVTEASPLTFPADTSSDEDNMDLKANGSRRRRFGIDFELGHTTQVLGATAALVQSAAYDAFPWRSVGGDGNRNHIIYQQGDKLYFHDMDIASVSSAPVAVAITPPGGGVAVNYVDLSWFKSDATMTAATLATYPIDITYGNGFAYVTSSVCETFYIKYVSTTGVYSVAEVVPAIRDYEEEQDGLVVDNRPAYASLALLRAGNPKHYYNLRNHGWTDAHLATYITAKGVAPSNADLWIYSKDAAEVFQPNLLDSKWFGTTRAPSGSFTYNPFNITRTSVQAGTTNYSTLARPSTCVFSSGRLFTAGVQDAKYSGTIFFSSVISNVDRHSGQYHPEADPTSEIVSDLQPSDGGVINIPETGTIYRLISIAGGIAVVAKNGIWHIRGGTDVGFTADSFSVHKVTAVGCDAPKSVVEVEGTLMYASRSGIYALTADATGLSLSSENITQLTIQSEFTAIPLDRLTNMKAIYDPVEREVKFYYTLVPSATDPTVCVYNNVLTLDLRLKAFYKTTFSGTTGTNPHINAVFQSLHITATGTYGTSIRHFCAVPDGLGAYDYDVAVLHSTTFLDWVTHDTVGVDYTSFLVTGYELFGEAMRNKQVDYITTFMKRTELTATDGTFNNQSACNMQVRFDWADHVDSQKWTTATPIYVYTKPYLLSFSPLTPGTEDVNYGYDVIVKKEKARGTGRAIQLRFESETGKDMQLLGWSILASGGTQP